MILGCPEYPARHAFGADGGMPELIRVFRVSHRESVNRLFFSPNGTILISTSENWTILWGGGGQPILKINNKEEGIQEEAINIDSFDDCGTNFVVAGLPGRVVDLPSGTERALINSSRLDRLKLSPDGKLIGGVSWRDGIKVWTTCDLEPCFEVPAHTSSGPGHTGYAEDIEFHGISFRSDGRYLLTLGRRRWAEWGIAGHHGEADEMSRHSPAVDLWDLKSRNMIHSVDPDDLGCGPHTGSCTATDGVFSADSSTIAVRLDDDVIVTLDANDLDVRNRIELRSCVEQFYLSPDGTRIVTIDEEGTAQIWIDHSMFMPIHESIEGPIIDPRNGFGLPVGRNEPLPRYRILGFQGEIVVETWPERQTVGMRSGAPAAIAVQPGSNCQAFAVSDEEGEIEFFRLEL